eukprot:8973083-Lingulodinium_polyedra.AAC.1
MEHAFSSGSLQNSITVHCVLRADKRLSSTDTNYRALSVDSVPMSEMVILANPGDVSGDHYDRTAWEPD